MLRPGRSDPTIRAPRGALRLERIVQLPEGLGELAADATADGARMLDVLQEDWAAGTLRFDGWGEALFAAHLGDALLGLCGLTRDPYVQAAAVGRVRRLYVLRAARRAGVGRALVDAVAEEAARSGYPRLRVRSPASAHAFYERCGFLRAVGEASATHVRPL